MTTIIPQVDKTMVEDLNKYVQFCNIWKMIKEDGATPKSSKFHENENVMIFCSSNEALVVSDVCNYNGVNVYLLSAKQNSTYQLIISEEYISGMGISK